MIFDRVVCGVDSSPASLEAARQASRLVAGSGRVLLVSVVRLEVAVEAGFSAGSILARLREEAEEALQDARREAEPLRTVETELLEGPPWVKLEEMIRREHATLVCVGSHEHRRATGIVLGSVATTLVHEAPCSVLVARAAQPQQFPSSIVVGIDGSPEAEAAAAVARALRERFGARVQPVVGAGGKGVNVDRLRASHPDLVVAGGKPVDALLASAGEADLIVVGSRGLHGVKALGSVSERVAHEAACSVLVVR